MEVDTIPRRSEHCKNMKHQSCFGEHMMLFGWSLAVFYENQTNRNYMYNWQEGDNANGSGTL